MTTLDTTELVVRAHGEPIPQGSMIGYSVGRRIIVQPSNKPKLTPWRKTVSEAAATAARAARWQRIDGPLEVAIVFRLPRPASAPRRRIWPEKKPDLDKLIRAILDALTDSAVIVDDARVVALTAIKTYGDPAGATITIRNGVTTDEWGRPTVMQHSRPVVASSPVGAPVADSAGARPVVPVSSGVAGKDQT